MNQVQSIFLQDRRDSTSRELLKVLLESLSEENKVVLAAVDSVLPLEIRQHLFISKFLIAKNFDLEAGCLRFRTHLA